jgi:hypothetical protein
MWRFTAPRSHSGLARRIILAHRDRLDEVERELEG